MLRVDNPNFSASLREGVRHGVPQNWELEPESPRRSSLSLLAGVSQGHHHCSGALEGPRVRWVLLCRPVLAPSGPLVLLLCRSLPSCRRVRSPTRLWTCAVVQTPRH